MGEFHQHPDGRIYIRSEFGLYDETRENFILDSGLQPPLMPVGANDHIYTQGQRHAYMGDGNIIAGGDREWEWGDNVIAIVRKLIKAKRARDKIAASVAAENERLAALEFAANIKAHNDAVIATQVAEDEAANGYQ
jgi:hypothetical protein